MKLLSIMMLLLVVTGCATLNKDQCQQGDWFGIGFSDGVSGETMDRMARHNEACAEYGIGVNSQQYMAGRAQGLNTYCRLDNAFNTGLSGQRYQRVCPPSIDGVFDRYNSAAYDVYELRNESNSIDNRLTNTESQMMKKDISRDEYFRLRQELRDLDAERNRIQMNLHSAERYLDQLRDEARTFAQ